MTYTDTKLAVPYFSQYRDIRDADHRLRGCGMTSTYMVLKYFGADVSSLDDETEKGMAEGGFGPSGWYHDYFVKLFRSYGFPCERREHLREREVADFRESLKTGNPVIISVVRRLWDQRLFHMVVLTGYREDEKGNLLGFFYHDPASMREDGSQHLYVDLSVFFLDWRGMAIFPRKS